MSEEGCVDVRRERQRSWSSEECSSSNNNKKRLSKAYRFHEGLDGFRVRLGGMQVIRGSHEDQGNYSKVEASGSDCGQGSRRRGTIGRVAIWAGGVMVEDSVWMDQVARAWLRKWKSLTAERHVPG